MLCMIMNFVSAYDINRDGQIASPGQADFLSRLLIVDRDASQKNVTSDYKKTSITHSSICPGRKQDISPFHQEL